MLLTIYNLPPNTRYNDIKALIQSNCGFKEMILDNLTQDGNNSKKVTIGLAEEEDAAILMRKINGYFLEGQQLFVEAFNKKQPANQNNSFNQNAQLRKPIIRNQPEPPLNQPPMPVQQPNLQQPYYQQSSYQTPVLMAYGGMYGVASNQNAFANYGYPQQTGYQSTSQSIQHSHEAFDLGGAPIGGAPLGFNDQGNNSSPWSSQNNWNPAANTSAWHKNSQEKSSRWDSPGESRKRPNRDEPTRDNGRDAPPHKFGRKSPSRDFGRDNSSRDFGRNNNMSSRDFGRDNNMSSRDFGRDNNMSSRDFNRVLPPRGFERDTSSRDNSRHPPSRDFGRDPPAREFGRVPPLRNFERNDSPREFRQDRPQRDNRRDAPMRDRGRDAPPRNFGRDAPPRDRARDAPVRDRGDERSTKKSGRDKKGNKFLQNAGFTRAAETWRGQAASLLAKEMIITFDLKKKYPNDEIDPVLFLKVLKRTLRTRIETVLGDNQHNIEIKQYEDMAQIYRNNYDTRTDAELFKEVYETTKQESADRETERALKRELRQEFDGQAPKNTETLEKSSLPPGKAQVPQGKAKVPPGKATVPPVKPLVPKGKPPGKAKPFVVPGGSQNATIPSYPHGDKNMFKAQKKQHAKIFEDEMILLSKVEPEYKNALEAEIKTCRELIEEELKEDPPPHLKTIHERIRGNVIDELLKVIKINYAKRVVNVGPVMLRIFLSKMVSRGKLAPILAEYGIDSLRKSTKKQMYIGSCASVDLQDKLCMQSIVVEGTMVSFKPLQMAGAPKKFKKGAKGQQQHFDTQNTDEDHFYEDEDIEGGMPEGGEENYQDEEKNDIHQGDEESMVKESVEQIGDDTTANITNDNDLASKIEDVNTDENGEQNDTNTDIKETGDEYVENAENVNETDDVPAVNTDFTADVNAETAEDETEHIDNIDMDDVNDDDLEDW